MEPKKRLSLRCIPFGDLLIVPQTDACRQTLANTVFAAEYAVVRQVSLVPLARGARTSPGWGSSRSTV
jgi:hypothetical protein